MIKAEDFKWLDRVYHLFHLGSYLCLSGALTDCFLPLIKFHGFYSEYMWQYYNAHEVLSWFPGQSMSDCPLALRMSLVFPVLNHWLASNRRIHEIIMAIVWWCMWRFIRMSFGCRDVIALWLPKYQWISGDTHEYSFLCTWIFIRTELLPNFQFPIEFACLAYL